MSNSGWACINMKSTAQNGLNFRLQLVIQTRFGARRDVRQVVDISGD